MEPLTAWRTCWSLDMQFKIVFTMQKTIYYMPIAWRLVAFANLLYSIIILHFLLYLLSLKKIILTAKLLLLQYRRWQIKKIKQAFIKLRGWNSY